MQGSARVPLSLPWEEPPLSLVFSSDQPLPAIPRVDGVGPRVDHAASVVSGECTSDPQASGVSSVGEVLVLEQFVCDDRVTAVDRVGVGSFLFALFARARLGDLHRVAKVTLDVSPDDPAWSNGFLDIVSLSHKTRAMSAALGLQLNLVAPSRRVSKLCWLKGFVSACEQALRPLLAIEHGSPFLCRPTGVGTWSEGPMRGDLVASWIRSILQAADPNMGSGITGHSAKATCLRCAKATLGMDTRAILGHHSLGGRKSVATYSRDL